MTLDDITKICLSFGFTKTLDGIIVLNSPIFSCGEDTFIYFTSRNSICICNDLIYTGDNTWFTSTKIEYSTDCFIKDGVLRNSLEKDYPPVNLKKIITDFLKKVKQCELKQKQARIENDFKDYD